ncbi:putative cation exchanger [Lachnellula suecica]|uniref:Putative cation exchanger n=1 Tax=Lachnellula suecica TaxID=602035 RepID=A0A8T9CHU8_9HELO|nr:putative cation exchanger [Lachnellula suecica]
MRQTSSHAHAAPIRQKRPRLSFRAFYITVLIISALAVFSLVADQSARYYQGSQYGASARAHWRCRLVHHAEDKCAFIKANCPDEQAGLLSYLELYYCNLGSAQPFAFVLLTLWLGILFMTIGIAASDFFCINLSTIASICGLSESLAGVTFLAFGNGSPDVFSTYAAMSSHSGSLAVGELIGAAGFITAVVAGSMALVREFKVGKKTFVRDIGFFIVAASFTMVFLSDGVLHLWECFTMIGFYFFYVAFVFAWHHYLSKRRARRERDAAARGQYLPVSSDEIEITEEDGDDEDVPAGQRRYRDMEDFAALERGSSPAYGSQAEDDSDEDGDEGMQLAAEMTSSMRVTRPGGTRRNTITPIRPSLMGALEFRSVLASLQKSRNSHARPIHLRRYSDDPIAAAKALSQHDGPVEEPEPYSDNASSIALSQAEGSDSTLRPGPSVRTRAVSMNDAVSVKETDPAAFTVARVPNIGIVAATPTFPQNLSVPELGVVTSPSNSPGPPSPTISLSPPPSITGVRDASPAPSQERRKRDTLAPPEGGFPGARHLRVNFPNGQGDSAEDSPKTSPRNQQRPRLQIPSPSSRDNSRSRSSSPIMQFPAYTDSPLPISAHSSKAPSLVLPEATMTPGSGYESQDMDFQERSERPIKWWPYWFLPSPYTLGSTLFPTLYTWKDKPIWDKFVSIISVPSIFLLAMTLPVVETESQNDDETDPALEERPTHPRKRGSTGPVLIPDSPSLETEPEWIRYRRATESQERISRSPQRQRMSGHDTATVAVSTENHHHHSHPTPEPPKQPSIHHLDSTDNHGESDSATKDWNRWLVGIQIFTAPLFVSWWIWSILEFTTRRDLVKIVPYSLLGSLIAFGIFTFTTTASQPPKYRFLFCFVGFAVAVAWIATIANEVVGVLKAFGVILGISDAILGLTIFAVGNSLGDLVADITVARLGYPVMALSACFGGPMLNILVGIGVSGAAITLRESSKHHAKHPDKAIKYKPYHIEVSRTLMISAITLLVTLVGLLIAVPLNKWVMSRRIGWGLIVLWSISTIINLGVEIGGSWGSTALAL